MQSLTPIQNVDAAAIAWIGVGQFLLAAALTYTTYRSREHSVLAGALAATLVSAGTVYAQYRLGRLLFEIPAEQTIQLVVASVVAGVGGLAVAGMALEPEIEEPLSEATPRSTEEITDG